MKYIQLVFLSLFINYTVFGQEWNSTGNNTTSGSILLNSDSFVSYAIERGNGAKSFFGITSNSHDGFLSSSGNLKFLTNNNGTTYTTTMFLNSSGNVGIGTTAPSAKLDIAGNTRMKATLDVLADGLSGHVASKVYLRSHNDFRGAGLFSLGQTNKWFMGNPYTDHADSFMIGVAPNSVTGDAVAQKQYSKFYVNSNGNVGIGTTAINNAKLNVVSNAISSGEKLLEFKVSDSDDYFRVINATSSDGQFIPSLYSYRGNDNRQSMCFYAVTNDTNDNGSNPLMVFDSRRSGSSIETRPLFAWDSYGMRKMILDADGNVGIGTTDTKGFKLGVNGDIAATKVKVALYNNWPDYVFEEAYELPTLKEVENHINEKGHLQNVPSAQEVAENGFFLEEMNAKLLQKIEELTLYTIAQEKQIEKLTKENEASKLLQEQLLALAKRVAELENVK